MKKLSSTLPNMILSLTIICLVISFLLGVMHAITAKPIAEAETKAKIDAIKVVVPPFDNNPFEEKMSIALPGIDTPFTVYPAKKGGAPVGYAIESYTTKGFSGRFDMMVGFDMEDNLIDFSILKHEETPGLGAKMQEWFTSPAKGEGVIRDFRNVNIPAHQPLKVTKDGGTVDAITAATITSRAFLDGIECAYSVYQAAKEQGSNKANIIEGVEKGEDASSSSADREPQNEDKNALSGASAQENSSSASNKASTTATGTSPSTRQ